MGQSQSNDSDAKRNDGSQNGKGGSNKTQVYDISHLRAEDEEMDKLAATLRPMIDDESRQQVDEYIQSCDDGKGPAAACFATGEYLGMFEGKHKEAYKLFVNTCFRPKEDKSPNTKEIDGTRAYGPGCYNMAKVLMTGKGGAVEPDTKKAYQVFDRACQAGHGGGCFIQAKMTATPPGVFGEGIPYDPYKSMELYQKVCDTGDSVACFTLATMLLRGDKISKTAENVTPQEAKGETPVEKRTNEEDRTRKDDDGESIPRDPKRAEELMKIACRSGAHAPSCFNLAVMYENGDDGVPADPEKAERYKGETQRIIQQFGGFAGAKGNETM